MKNKNKKLVCINCGKEVNEKDCESIARGTVYGYLRCPNCWNRVKYEQARSYNTNGFNFSKKILSD